MSVMTRVPLEVQRIARLAQLAEMMDRFDPEDRPIHCRNCKHAVVSGTAEEPKVRCEMGHGHKASHRGIPLARLIRPSHPTGFRNAASCPDFFSLSDGSAVWRQVSLRVVS